jgi:hypothetical protein
LQLAHDELCAGRLPTWNPLARGGAPLHGQGVLGLCYPPNWLALTTGDPAARLGWLAWLSLATAGLFTFGLLREVKLSVHAAWFGATVFQLGLPMAANAFFWMRLASFVWLPGVLWSCLALAHGDRLRAGPLAATALTFAMPWLAGFPPFATATTAIAGLFVLRLIAERLGREGSQAARELLVRFVAAFGIGALLTLPQVLPSLLFFHESARDPNASLAMINTSRFDAYGLVGYVLPDAFGHPTAAEVLPYGASPLPLWLCDRGHGVLPQYNFSEYSVFFGTFGLLLAGFGAVRGRGHGRWFCVIVLGLLLGLALMVPGVHLLFLLPGVNTVWPARWLVCGSLLLAWLAAIGFDRLWHIERRALLRLGGAALVLAAIVSWLASRPAAWHGEDPTWLARAIAERMGVSIETVVTYVSAGAPAGLDRFAAACERCARAGYEAGLWFVAFGALVLGFGFAERHLRVRWALLGTAMVLTVAQLAATGRTLLHGTSNAHSETPVHAFLREQAAAAAAQGGFTIVRTGITSDIPSQLPPGQLMVPGLRDLNFYRHFDARSLEPVRRVLGKDYGDQAAWRGYLERLVPDAIAGLPYAPLEHPLFDLLGVRYALAVRFAANAPLPVHAGVRVGPELRGPGGEFFVFERPHPLPRAFTVPALRVLPDDEAVLAALADPAFAPRDAALVTAQDAGPDAARTGAGAPRSVRFASDHPADVVLEVGAGENPWLVVTDTLLPGWSATVDDRPAAIVRTDHAFRLVALPSDACRVRFTYSCPGLGAGTLLAGFATVALLLVWLVTRRSAPFAART